VRLEQSFEVAAPLEEVWSALIDVERVAPCLPGASVSGRNEDGSYNGTFTVKIGPTSAAYSGKLQMETIDESARTATMQANGTDKRGQGGAKATIVSSLSPAEGGGTRVEVITDYHITGRLARFGRGGMIEDISERLLRQFAKCLQESMLRAPGDSQRESPAAASSQSPAGKEQEAGAALPHNGGDPASAGVDAPPSPSAAPPPPPGPEEPTQAEAVQGLSLLASVMWDRTRRNPLPALAGLGLLLALLMIRRARR
jgi:uncharacterized protein